MFKKTHIFPVKIEIEKTNELGLVVLMKTETAKNYKELTQIMENIFCSYGGALKKCQIYFTVQSKINTEGLITDKLNYLKRDVINHENEKKYAKSVKIITPPKKLVPKIDF